MIILAFNGSIECNIKNSPDEDESINICCQKFF
jgi:hypothetical protein